MTVQECLEHPWLAETCKLSITSHSLGSLLNTSTDTYDIKLRVVIPESDKIYDVKDKNDKTEENPPLLPLVKHPHHKDKSPPFPDAPSTPKVSRKSLPDSPTSVLSHCKLFQMDNSLYGSEKILGCKNRDTCDSVFSTGKVLGVCKTFESLPSAVNGKSHTKENNPLVTKNGANGTCVGYDNDVIKVSTEPTYPDCSQCESCNLMSSHKHATTPIKHERAILC